MKRINKILLSMTVTTGLMGNYSIFAYAGELPKLQEVSSSAYSSEIGNASTSLKNNVNSLSSEIANNDSVEKSTSSLEAGIFLSSSNDVLVSSNNDVKVNGKTITLPCNATVGELYDAITVDEDCTFDILENAKGDSVEDYDQYVNSKMVVAVTNEDDKVIVYKLKITIEHKLRGSHIGTVSSSQLKEVPYGTTVGTLLDALTVSDGAEATILTKTKGKVITDMSKLVTSTMVVKVTGMDGKSSEYKISIIKSVKTAN